MPTRQRLQSACLLVALVTVSAAAAQPSSSDLPEPVPADVETLDGIIRAYYEVVSGAAGEPRQWRRDSSLHHPQASVLIVGAGPGGRVDPRAMSLAEYHARSSGLSDAGFFEVEINRQVQRHGAIAHAWSTYEWRRTPDGPVGGRGVNSIQLVHDGDRWWITSWMFDGRNDAPPVPPEYLPERLRNTSETPGDSE